MILPSVEVQVSSNKTNQKGEGVSQSRRGAEKKINLKGDAGVPLGIVNPSKRHLEAGAHEPGLSAQRPASARFPTRPRVRITGERRRSRPADFCK